MHPLIREIQKGQLQKIPEIRPGYTVRIQQKIKEVIKEGDEEGAKIASKKKATEVVRERIQVFEGLVIKVGAGHSIQKSFTVRKVVEGVGVEKTFLLHSPGLLKVEIKKKGQVRRAKLYYMRKRSGKSARLNETQVSDKERAAEEAKMEALIQEAVVAEEKKKVDEAEQAPVAAETSGENAAQA